LKTSFIFEPSSLIHINWYESFNQILYYTVIKSI